MELISLWNKFLKGGGGSPDFFSIFRAVLNATLVLATYSSMGSQGILGEVLLPLLRMGSDPMS